MKSIYYKGSVSELQYFQSVTSTEILGLDRLQFWLALLVRIKGIILEYRTKMVKFER